MKAHLPTYLLVILMLLSLTAWSQKNGSATNNAQAILVLEDDWGDKEVVGWSRVDDMPEGCTTLWTNERKSHIRFDEIFSGDLQEITQLYSKKIGFHQLEILASEKLQKASLLDAQGHGWAVIASAVKDQVEYKLAMLFIYGTFDDSPRSTGVHTYIAPASDFVNTGGWVVPATFWLGIDPKTDVGKLAVQGAKTSEDQAEILASLADIWIESIYHQYIQQMQMNVQALHNLRISVIAAGDPNAVIINGADGYNEIEYRY